MPSTAVENGNGLHHHGENGNGVAAQQQHANGNGVAHALKGQPTTPQQQQASIFPEALMSLEDADPQLFAIVEQEKVRQW